MGKKNFSYKEFYEKHQIWINVVYILIATFVLLWLSVIFMKGWTKYGETAVIPKVIGLDYVEASDVLKSKGFNIEIDSIYDKTAQYGSVLDQSPKENEIVKYGRVVYLKINSFYPQLEIIDIDKLLHVSPIQAQNMLQALGFSNIKITEEVGDNDDEVINVKCNGRSILKSEKVPITSEITLIVTYNPNNVYVDSISVVTANESLLGSESDFDTELIEE